MRRDRLTSVIASLGVLSLTAGMVVLGTAAPASAHTSNVTAHCEDGVVFDARSYKAHLDNVWSVTIGGTTQTGTFGSTFADKFPVPQGGATTRWSAYTKQQGEKPGDPFYFAFEGKVGPCGKPAPKVDERTEERKSCDDGLETRTITTTTSWTWDDDEDEWVEDSATTATDWVKVRDLTNAEKKALDCDKPNEPRKDVVTSEETRQSCEAGVEKRTKTVTTSYSFDDTSWIWVPDKPVTTLSDWTTVRDLTHEEKVALGCDKPDQPPAFAISGTEQRLSCEDGLEERTFTSTTEFVFDEETFEWVEAEPVITFSDWTTIRPLNEEEAAELDCLIPPTEAVDVCFNIPGAQESVPDGLKLDGRTCVEPDEVLGTEAPEPFPTAVDAGFGGPWGPTAGPRSPASPLGMGLVTGGLMMLLMAGARWNGRRGLVGARQA